MSGPPLTFACRTLSASAIVRPERGGKGQATHLVAFLHARVVWTLRKAAIGGRFRPRTSSMNRSFLPGKSPGGNALPGCSSWLSHHHRLQFTMLAGRLRVLAWLIVAAATAACAPAAPTGSV